MFKITTILCPVDFSDASLMAIKYAREFAAATGASIFLLHIVEPVPMPPVDTSLNYVEIEEVLEKAAEKDLNALKNSLLSEGVKVDGTMETGKAADIILEKASKLNANFIIMGSHGRKGLNRLIMGSVADAVIRRSDCPVLIVKSGEKEFIDGK
ncbi:MAG: universal stress protein [Chlorobiaceae bacterium]|nr:universal stress protein [Chlorobiaceae bacterium]NTV60291.1 universal stress protein [Chlorobiaceae bacterium]